MTGYLSRQNRWKNWKMTNKKALFLDMDGTTLDDQSRIPEANRRALEQAVRAGHEVIITTGRPTVSARNLLADYGLDRIGCRYVIAYNGGMMLDCVTGEVLFSQTIPLDQVKELIRCAREDGLYIQTYEGDYVLTDREDENLRHYTSKTSMNVKVVPDLLKAIREEPCKMLAIDSRSQDVMDAFRSRMSSWAQDKVDMYYSCAAYMEIVPKGICKGNALRAFCRKKGIPVEQTIAVGDENNDLSMIEAAGVGCAVANAIDVVKAAADYVTERDNNHSAIEEIIYQFIL